MSEEFDLDIFKQWAQAYPIDIFKPLEGDHVEKTGHYDTKEKCLIITRASAAMGRHMGETALKPMIAEIERLRAIETASVKLRDDMIQRADIGTYDGDHDVQAGATVWWVFCEAIEPSPDPTPWCHVCLAMERAECKCLPIAKNH